MMAAVKIVMDEEGEMKGLLRGGANDGGTGAAPAGSIFMSPLCFHRQRLEGTSM